MMTNKITVGGTFEVLDDDYKMLAGGQFITVEGEIPLDLYDVGLKCFGVASTVRTKKYNLLTPIANASVTAYKNGKVYDHTTTDINGDYILYLEKGSNYSVKIQSQSISKTISSYQLNAGEGINEFKTLIKNCQIIEKKFDMLKPYDHRGFLTYQGDKGLRYIDGTIVNENGEPVVDAEIVVSRKKSDPQRVGETNEAYAARPKIMGEVLAFVKTGKDGRYGFAIEMVGQLDAILRAPGYHANILKGYTIQAEPEDSFINTVKKNSITFDKGGNSIGHIIK